MVDGARMDSRDDSDGTVPGPVIQIASQGPGIHVRVTDLGGSDKCMVSSIMFEVYGPNQKSEAFGFSSESILPSRAIHLKYSQGQPKGIRAFGKCDGGSTRTRYSNTLPWYSDSDARSWTNFKAPINVQQVDINSTSGISLSWEEPEGGPRAEYYSARCFLSTDPNFISPVYCASSNPIASVDRIPPKTEFATFTNLKPSTLYKCFVVAMDEYHWKCSEPVLVDYQSYGTCESHYGRKRSPDARLATCGTHKGMAQDVQAGRAALLRAYGLEIVDMSGTTIQRKIESFPGATIPLHFNICINNSSETSNRYPPVESVIPKQIEVINQAFAEAKITFTQGETVFCMDKEQEMIIQRCLGGGEDQNDNCAAALFSLDGVTEMTGGIATILAPSNLPFLGKASRVGLYNESAPSIMSIQFTTLPGMVPKGAYDGGMTLPHEIGHVLGLLHPWEEFDYPENPDELPEEITDLCLEERDPMPSTPVTIDNVFCDLGSDTCPSKPGRDPINNIMGYSEDCCMTGFTMEQIVLMQANILTYAPLWLNNS